MFIGTQLIHPLLPVSTGCFESRTFCSMPMQILTPCINFSWRSCNGVNQAAYPQHLSSRPYTLHRLPRFDSLHIICPRNNAIHRVGTQADLEEKHLIPQRKQDQTILLYLCPISWRNPCGCISTQHTNIPPCLWWEYLQILCFYFVSFWVLCNRSIEKTRDKARDTHK